jgi:hypothetical protein
MKEPLSRPRIPAINENRPDPPAWPPWLAGGMTGSTSGRRPDVRWPGQSGGRASVMSADD